MVETSWRRKRDLVTSSGEGTLVAVEVVGEGEEAEDEEGGADEEEGAGVVVEKVDVADEVAEEHGDADGDDEVVEAGVDVLGEGLEGDAEELVGQVAEVGQLDWLGHRRGRA